MTLSQVFPETSDPCHPRHFNLDSLTSALLSRQGFKAVSQLRGEDAVEVVEILDRALQSPDFDVGRRNMYTVMLRNLCGACGILPNSYTLDDGLEIVSPEPHASGGFAELWKGQYNGSLVAIKSLKAGATERIEKLNKRLCKEVLMWKRLSHQNILPFLCISTLPVRLSMVSVWMLHGNVVEYVQASPQANRLALLSDVANGLSYLHMMDVVHGDLKGANILIDQDLHARLADFGLMTILFDPEERYAAINNMNDKETWRWMAPELLNSEVSEVNHGNPSKESDIYAMGMVILEVMSGCIPFHRYRNLEVIQMVLADIRPERPADAVMIGLSDGVWQTVELCWHKQLNKRPVIGLVFSYLTEASQNWNLPSPERVSDSDANECLDDWIMVPNFPPRTQRQRLKVPDDIPHPHVDLEITTRPTTRSTFSLDLKQLENRSSLGTLPNCHIEGSQGDVGDTRSRKSLWEVITYFPRVILRSWNDKRAFDLSESGTAFITRFERTNEFEDLDEAIDCYREALDLRPSGHPMRSMSLKHLGNAIYYHFRRTWKLEDLEDAIAHIREALILQPSKNPDRWNLLIILANAIRNRFRLTQNSENLDDAIVLYHEALDLLLPGDPNQSISQNNLANATHDRFRRTQKLEDLMKAISHSREALNLLPPGNPDRWIPLTILAHSIRDRFRQTQNLADLEEAIVYYREALVLRPPGISNQSMSLNNLANVIYNRFRQTENMEDLQEAISYQREALDLRHHGNPNLSISLNTLVVDQNECFRRNQKFDGVEETIACSREALDVLPPENPHRPYLLNNLARTVYNRFDPDHRPEELEEAIVYLREAISLFPPENPDRSNSLNDLACVLHDRFKRTGQFEDLKDAIAYHLETLDLRPPGNPDRSTTLHNLALAVLDRFRHTKRMEDLDEADKLVAGAEAAGSSGEPGDIQLKLQNLRNTIDNAYMTEFFSL